MTGNPRDQDDRVREACRLLREAERPVRVLRTLAWPLEVKARFFADGCRELPRVEYEPHDPTKTLEIVDELRRRPIGEPVLDAWIARQATAIAHGARMLAAAGTLAFFRHAREVYGAPTDPLTDDGATPLDLARRIDESLCAVEPGAPGIPELSRHSAEEVADGIRLQVVEHFGDSGPEVVVVDQLSANALAGPTAIRLRRGAVFSDRDVDQLVHHEAFVHVATSLNGRAQELPILAAGHPGTTRTQEGLAVFSEFISTAMDPSRLGKLALRVLAIHQAAEGADFLDVFRFFGARGFSEEQAFESTRRVFRGGVLTGRAPFTKDMVYLDGLLRVHDFLRVAVISGRSDCIRLLFAGKLDLEDVVALSLLAERGLVAPARFVPPWLADMRYLIAHLAYTSFLQRVDVTTIERHFSDLLDQSPYTMRPPSGAYGPAGA